MHRRWWLALALDPRRSNNHAHRLYACRESGGHTAWNRWTPRGSLDLDRCVWMDHCLGAIDPAPAGDDTLCRLDWACRRLDLAGLQFDLARSSDPRAFQVATYCHDLRGASPSEQWQASAGYSCKLQQCSIKLDNKRKAGRLVG